jgi:hypothetical protein
MFQELANIITELSSHNPDIDWAAMPLRIDHAIQAIMAETPPADIIRLNRLQCIRGSLLCFVASNGCENSEGFLVGIAKTELLKIEWA